MSRWGAYRCGYCGAVWSVEAQTIASPVRCPGCGYMAYVMQVDELAQPAASLRRLAAEIRKAATWQGVRPLLPPSPETLARWAEEIERCASECERMTGQEVDRQSLAMCQNKRRE